MLVCVWVCEFYLKCFQTHYKHIHAVTHPQVASIRKLSQGAAQCCLAPGQQDSEAPTESGKQMSSLGIAHVLLTLESGQDASQSPRASEMRAEMPSRLLAEVAE